MHRPQSILWFERLYLGALAIGILNTILTWNQAQALIESNPDAAMLGTGFMIFTTAIGVVIQLLLWFFTARRRSTIAKWILVAFFALGVIGLLIGIAGGTYPAGSVGILAAIAFVMQVAAVVMLFRRDAVAWFEGRDATEAAAPFE